MASMPLGPQHQPPQLQSQPQQNNDALKLANRRSSDMETDKVRFLSLARSCILQMQIGLRESFSVFFSL